MPISSFFPLDKHSLCYYYGTSMGDDGGNYNLSLLRGWKREQLKLLLTFTRESIVSQARLSGVSGMHPGTCELGGKITPLVRANLIEKVGRDKKGQFLWTLNERAVNRKALEEFLKPFKLDKT